MIPNPSDVIRLYRETSCPISDCRDAIAKSLTLDDARRLLAAWRLGKPSDTGEVPSRWESSDSRSESLSLEPKKCPKCRHYFEAIPDVVTCEECGYSFRSSSPEFPNLFLPLVKLAPADVSSWFIADQLARVRQVFALMADYWPVDENERNTLKILASQFGSESAIDMTMLLQNLSGPKVRALGELFVAMAGDDGSINQWIETWRDV